jgi:hypothetical protein
MRSNGSDCPTLCILPLLRRCGRINGPNVLMDLGGPTIPISSLFTKIEEKGKRCNALTTSVNLMVVNDHGSSNKISSVDSLLIPTLLLRNLKRVVPPRTGLLRLARSSPFSGFLVNLSKKGKSL